MPIEIKEISIKADIYPQRREQPPGPDAASGLSPAELERIKKEISREVYRTVMEQIRQNNER